MCELVAVNSYSLWPPNVIALLRHCAIVDDGTPILAVVVYQSL
jgi:hypothetical protein